MGNSLRIGVEQELPGSHVPVSELFFSGGGSTLRGFPLNGAGPHARSKYAAILPMRSRALSSMCLRVDVNCLLQLENRIPMPIKKGLGFVAFYDGGNVFEHVEFRDFESNYTNSCGDRLPLRHSDWTGTSRSGAQLQRVARNKASTQLFITLGQAF